MAIDWKYVVVDTTSKSQVDFSQVAESEDSLRYSIDGTKFIVKFTGATPSSIVSLKLTECDHDGIISIINTSAWTPEEEDGLYD
jgi:hypothetical protein